MLASSTVDRIKPKTKTLLSLVSKYRIPTYGLVSMNFHYTYSVQNDGLVQNRYHNNESERFSWKKNLFESNNTHFAIISIVVAYYNL